MQGFRRVAVRPLSTKVRLRHSGALHCSGRVAAPMEARLVAAQRGLIWLLVVSAFVLLVGLPRPGDARIAHGFEELSQFARAVDLVATEGLRHKQAMQFAQ